MWVPRQVNTCRLRVRVWVLRQVNTCWLRVRVSYWVWVKIHIQSLIPQTGVVWRKSRRQLQVWVQWLPWAGKQLLAAGVDAGTKLSTPSFVPSAHVHRGHLC